MVTRGNQQHNPATFLATGTQHRARGCHGPSWPHRHALVVALSPPHCSQQVYSPPSQTFALGGIRSLEDGQSALASRGLSHSQIFDPAVLALDGRWHAGLGDNAEASIEGTAHRVDDTGPRQRPSVVLLGRAGIRTNPAKSGAVFFAGAGGGYAAAGGGFASADSGLAIGYDNCTVVPVMQASGFISQPLDARAIDVSDVDEHRDGYAEAYGRRRASHRSTVLAVAVELSRR